MALPKNIVIEKVNEYIDSLKSVPKNITLSNGTSTFYLKQFVEIKVEDSYIICTSKTNSTVIIDLTNITSIYC